MASHSAMILVLFVGFFLCFQSTNGYKFFVGGKDGWVVHPSEDYSHWSQRNRFNVNDTLYFKYKKGEDSVLEVTKEQFNVCNTTGPLLKMEDGSSEVKLARSGPFYFISGGKENCDKGQKLLVVVISEHHRRPQAPSPSPSSPSPAPPKTSPSPSPVSSPPPASPPPHSAPSHSPTAPAPASPSPAPVSPSPKVSPSPAPTYPSPKVSLSPAPTSPSPKVSPSTAPTSPSPKVSPSPAPTSPSPEVPAPTPEASAPAADQGSPAPAPAPSKNAGAKILMALPVTGALMACSIALF